jgi:hypothetical protein
MEKPHLNVSLCGDFWLRFAKEKARSLRGFEKWREKVEPASHIGKRSASEFGIWATPPDARQIDT